MILRILNKNIFVDFFQTTQASIKLDLAKTSVMIIYENTLAAFHNQINQKFSPEFSSSNNRSTRRINENGTRGGGKVGIFQG